MKKLLVFLIFVFVSVSCLGAGAGKKPNVIFIMADDLGYGDMSCYGATYFKTPACDRLAGEGMRFTDAHTPSAVCSPTRYAVLTGRYAWRSWLKNWVLFEKHPLLIDTERLTMGKLFQRAGYTTGCIGKWHLGWGTELNTDFSGEAKPGPLEVGFDSFYGVPHSHNSGKPYRVFVRDRKIVNLKDGLKFDSEEAMKDTVRKLEDTAINLSKEAVAFIERNKEKPFFLYYPTTNIHFPITPNSRFKDTTQIGAYGEFVVEFDWAVGQVLDALDRNGLTDNTIVVLTSDNGGRPPGRLKDLKDFKDHKCNGPWRGTKRMIYEGGHRVPLIVRWPGKVKPDAVTDETVCLTDFFATFAGILKQQLPDNAGEDSYDLTNLLTGKQYKKPLRQATVHHSVAGQFAIRQGDWKLIESGGDGDYPRNDKGKIDIKAFNPKRDPVTGKWTELDYFELKPDGKFQLYNLKTDPNEQNDLSETNPEKVNQLRDLLNQYRKSGRSTPRRTAEVNEIVKSNVGGYFHAGKDRVEDSYNAGFSMYSAVWPLLKEYPGRSFQSGLFGTWMGPVHGKPAPEKDMRLYTKIEGGLGWWRATEFPTTTPKFIMGGVELNFRGWANGPGSGKGRDWSKPRGAYGVAQLSPWLLFPPDGLNLKQGTCGELFGYGYLPLPLTEPKTKTAGEDIPTGNHCWTLFLNTGNFKGPVAFFTPYFWSRVTVEDPRLAGMFFDTRPCKANRSLSMETQHIHCAQVTDSKGDTYARMTQTQFPVGDNNESVILHRLSAYNKKALWDGVKSWFQGGEPVDGRIAEEGTYVQKFNGHGGAGWRVYNRYTPKDKLVPFAMEFMSTKSPDPYTFGLQWDMKLVAKRKTEFGSLVIIPEYYKQVKTVAKRRGKDVEVKKWVAVDAEDIPAQTGLDKVSFKRPKNDRPSEARMTPEDPNSCWKIPGPSAGPFKVKVGDGSTVTYYWYRFADQPALLNADMTDQERERLQKRVEMLHRRWTKDREYLAPPTVGKLADIDPVLVVTPPKGMEVGYVPVVTKQELEK